MSTLAQIAEIRVVLSERSWHTDAIIDRIREIVGADVKGRRIAESTKLGRSIVIRCHDRTMWVLHLDNTQKWHRLPDIPQDTLDVVDPDPIAELEALGGTIQPCWIEGRWELTWFAAAFTAQEPIGEVVRLSDLRAAAARLLARVRGTSRGQVPYLEATGGSECGASLEEQAEESKT